MFSSCWHYLWCICYCNLPVGLWCIFTLYLQVIFEFLCVAVRKYMYVRGVLPVSEVESVYVLNLYVSRRESISSVGAAGLD